MASSLQAAIVKWTTDTFGPESAKNPEVRLRKLWDEMEELVRAWGDRPNPEGRGNPEIIDEVGDVYLCLLAFGASLGVDVEAAGAAKMAKLGSRVYEFDPMKGWTRVGG
jgi:NTP pyrophosphatase (non-canonical NTP hydrolase)